MHIKKGKNSLSDHSPLCRKVDDWVQPAYVMKEGKMNLSPCVISLELIAKVRFTPPAPLPYFVF